MKINFNYATAVVAVLCAVTVPFYYHEVYRESELLMCAQIPVGEAGEVFAKEGKVPIGTLLSGRPLPQDEVCDGIALKVKTSTRSWETWPRS